MSHWHTFCVEFCKHKINPTDWWTVDEPQLCDSSRKQDVAEGDRLEDSFCLSNLNLVKPQWFEPDSSYVVFDNVTKPSNYLQHY